MKAKRYKVKYDQGVIVPLEPMELDANQVGEVVFYDKDRSGDNTASFTETKLNISPQMMLSHTVLKKIWDNPEDEAYDDL